MIQTAPLPGQPTNGIPAPQAMFMLASRTSYTYDDYKRLRTITTPLRATGDTTGRITTYLYTLDGANADDYSRTASVPTKILSPGGATVTMSYDENLRNLAVRPVGDANVSDGKTSYTYDNNGNVYTVKEPNARPSGVYTTYNYDKQNRVSSIVDPIATDRNPDTGHTMDLYYDPSGNKVKEIRADKAFCLYDYNNMGRLRSKTGYGNEIIGYSPDEDGNNLSVTVPGGKIYGYTYDHLDRIKTATYPADYANVSRSEIYTYDTANHLWKYKNPAGHTKTLTYDSRGRLTNGDWSCYGPDVTVAYDDTRPTSIATAAYAAATGVTSPATLITFGYDEANNRVYEEQSIDGLPVRRVQTDPNADGNRKNLLVKTGTTTNFATTFDYTSRNELLNIYDANGALFFTYGYDASGNVIKRTEQKLGTATAPDKAVFQYDALNRPTYCAQYQPGVAAPFAVSHYHYSKRGNLHDTTRDEEGGKGDWFDYE